MKKTVVLTFDDACRSHLEFVAPLLREYGFGATFFVCRPENWLAKDPEAFLSGPEIGELYRDGFEIGNHTLNHITLTEADEEQSRADIAGLNALLAANGIPAPVSFAYPGGPYAEKAARWLGDFGFRCARTTETGLWSRETDPMRVPSWSICLSGAARREEAIAALEASEGEGAAAVLLYHGVPDEVHPWVNTPPEMLVRHLDSLKEKNFRVVSMRTWSAELQGR